MERTIETTGKTVEQAIQEALRELSVAEDRVVIEVLDEGETGGLLGFGRRPARVRVTMEEMPEDEVDEDDDIEAADDDEVDEDRVDYDDGDDEDDGDGWKVPADERGIPQAENAVLDYIEAMLSGIGIHGRIESYLADDGSLHIDIIGNDCGVAIGRHGETLDAIQYLSNIVANRYVDDYVRIVVDAAGYRRRREQRLQQQARRVAKRVLDTGRESRLKPMSPAERRIVHLTLRDTDGITTYSEGAEPRRYVVISPTAGLEIIG
ncbi:MAG: RNA-binding cell elongation regulator Jag/EloR [Saccharofermentanales bacterium]|jgi:spoIIIJ-associated protein